MSLRVLMPLSMFCFAQIVIEEVISLFVLYNVMFLLLFASVDNERIEFHTVIIGEELNAWEQKSI